MVYFGKPRIPDRHYRQLIHRPMQHGLMILLPLATNISTRRLSESFSPQTLSYTSRTTTRWKTPETAAYSRSASTAGHFKTSWLQVVPLVSAVTMVQSAVAAAIRWLVAKRGQAILVAASRRLWTCISPGGIPSCCDGASAAIVALLVKAGG